MKRILIVGSGGAGKSTIARKIGEILELPVIHLDAHFWNAGWRETPRDEWEIRVNKLIKGDNWIIDGNFDRTLPARLERADTVILLDIPHMLCIWRVIKRCITHRGKTRPDMAPHCPEKADMEFLKWIWNYPVHSRPKVLNSIAKAEHVRCIILQSPNQINGFLKSLD